MAIEVTCGSLPRMRVVSSESSAQIRRVISLDRFALTLTFRIGMISPVISYATIWGKKRLFERGTDAPDDGDRARKLAAAELLLELGGYRAARLVQRGLQANRLGCGRNGYLPAVGRRPAPLDVSFRLQPVQCPRRGGPRNGERLGQLALQELLPLDHRAQHEGLRRRQAEVLEGFAPFALEPACESRRIEIQAVIEHGAKYKPPIVSYATIWPDHRRGGHQPAAGVGYQPTASPSLRKSDPER